MKINWTNTVKAIYGAGVLWLCAWLLHQDFNWWRGALFATALVSVPYFLFDAWKR